MATPIVFSGTTYPPTYVGTDDGAASAAFSVDNASTYTVTVTGTVTAPGDTVQLTFGSDAPAAYAGTTITLTASQYDNSGMIEFTSPTLPPNATDTGATSYRYLLSNTALHGKFLSDGTTRDPQRTRFTSDANDTTLQDYQVANAPCFVTGTRLRVVRDGVTCDIAVEDLVVGDLAVTASGALRPVEWIGHRAVDCRRDPCPEAVMPVHIAAHAFGANRPARELVVSPGHSICVEAMGEVLVPAVALVNGTTIVQRDADHVTYWHVELGSHDIVLAENMPTESYLEMGNRHFFAEEMTVLLNGRPDAPVVTHDDFCRPFVIGGPRLDVIRARLAARAVAIAGSAELGRSAA